MWINLFYWHLFYTFVCKVKRTCQLQEWSSVEFWRFSLHFSPIRRTDRTVYQLEVVEFEQNVHCVQPRDSFCQHGNPNYVDNNQRNSNNNLEYENRPYHSLTCLEEFHRPMETNGKCPTVEMECAKRMLVDMVIYDLRQLHAPNSQPTQLIVMDPYDWHIWMFISFMAFF